MDLELSDDQVALRDGIASMLVARVPMERVRRGFDRALFADLADAGVFSLRADGFGWSDCVVVFEQLGRQCVPGPLAVSLLVGDGQLATAASEIPPIWIEHLGAVDIVVVDRVGGFQAVDAQAIEAEVSAWPLDPCTPVARADALPAGPLIELDRSDWMLGGATLTAAFSLGLADRLTELSVEYAKERIQFDRPIGSFQAIKHMLADMLTRTELARAAVYAAGAQLDEGRDHAGFDRLVSSARITASDAAIANGKAATQVFGGMGYTWEVDVHLYLKRAWALETHFETAERHCEMLAAALLGSR